MPRPASFRVPHKWETIPCVVCGVEFTKRKLDPKRTCSPKCQHESASRSRRRRVDRTCTHCGGPFWVHEGRLKREGRGVRLGQFCSRSCTYAFWKANPSEHPGVRGKDDFSETVDPTGYVIVYVKGRGRIREHRYVMEQVLGRRLEPRETVHHKNGDRTDNRPENLELWQGAQPSGVRSSDATAVLIAALEARIASLELRLKE